MKFVRFGNCIVNLAQVARIEYLAPERGQPTLYVHDAAGATFEVPDHLAVEAWEYLKSESEVVGEEDEDEAETEADSRGESGPERPSGP